ncbi:MAG: hypothetical protein HRU15_12520, partial [Planctomycetes bacterium]|nr:hypothetical protein [Planctomycetota bacterium]
MIEMTRNLCSRFCGVLLSLLCVVALSMVGGGINIIGAEGDSPEDILEKLKKEFESNGGTIIIKSDGESSDGSFAETVEGPNPFEAAVDMRWRIYTNQEAGMAFRFPYFYRILDQYGAKLMRHYGRSGMNPDLEFKTAVVEDISKSAGGDDLQSLAYHLIGNKGIKFKTYDYYNESDARPHADDKWAPEGIQAIRGESETASAMFVLYNGRVSGLISDGALGYNLNDEIFDTFEVMNREKKYRKRQKGALMTWRESIGNK